jgi:heterodisulfide reductase subunit A
MELIASAVARVSLHEPLEENEVGVTPAVLVIGGGIAGVQASLDIAHSGFEVYLLEKSPTLGGHLAQLDRTFPNLEETSSILFSKMEEVANHPLIHLLTNSDVEDVEGFVGNFKVKIKHDPRCVDPGKCNRCKKCEEVCPVRIPSEFDMELVERKAIYLPSPHAVPLVTSSIQRTASSCKKESAENAGMPVRREPSSLKRWEWSSRSISGQSSWQRVTIFLIQNSNLNLDMASTKTY